MTTNSQMHAKTAKATEPVVTVHATPDLSPAATEALDALVNLAKQKMIEEHAAPQDSDVPALEALGYHAMGLPYSLERTEAERDGAYRERAHLVALIAGGLAEQAVVAPAPDVDEPGWQILYATLHGRQCSWHFSPRDADLIEYFERVPADDPRAQWDGHTTEAKYEHIAYLARALGTPGAAPHL